MERTQQLGEHGETGPGDAMSTQPAGPANLNGVSYNSDVNKNGIPDGQEYDRSASTDATKPWRSGPPNGAVTIGDVIVELAQVGDNCTT